MKRILSAALVAVLLIMAGCSAQTDPQGSTQPTSGQTATVTVMPSPTAAEPSATVTVVPSPTAAEPSATVTVVPSPTAAEPSATATVMPSPTAAEPSVTATVTPTATPLQVKDIELLMFDQDANINSVVQEDLSYYGISLSDLTLTTKRSDSGSGLRVSLDNDSSKWCQGLQFSRNKLSSVFAKANTKQYIRFWVSNPTNTKLGVMLILYKGTSENCFDSTKAMVTRCDGQKVQLVTDYSAGAGENTSVLLDAGFSGWITFKISDWNGFDITKADGFKLDMRPKTAAQGEYYVLDDFVLTDAPAGTQREFTDELPKIDEDKFMELRQELDSKIKSYLNVVPVVKYYPAYDPVGKSNVKALTYDAAMIGDKKTKAFAYIGYPKNMQQGKKYPAVVLIHGGGGHAFHDWVTAWTDKGYVAIAMDNTGFFPNGPSANPYQGTDWKWGLSRNPDFKENGYTNVMQTDHFASSGNPVEEQWMYHAVVQAILAHNLLAADPMVDAGKIGITGISWGSVVTSLTIGYDKYAFAIPQYCAGYLNESLTYKGDYSKNYPAYDYLWQAEDRWDNVDFPVLFLQYTKDGSATPSTNSKCYLHLKDKGAELTLIMNWFHGHDWSKQEAFNFAESVLNGKQALTKAVNEPTGRSFNFNITIPEGINVTAKICYMKKPFANQVDDNSNVWYTANATVSGNTVSGTVPEDATHYYVEFTNNVSGKSLYSATSIVYLNK